MWATTCTHHLAGLHHPVLDAAAAGCLEIGVVELAADAGHPCLGRINAGLRLPHLGLCHLQPFLDGLNLGTCHRHGRFGAVHARAVLVDLLLRNGPIGQQRLGASERGARHAALSLALAQHGLGGDKVGTGLGHQRQGRHLLALRIEQLGLGLVQHRLHGGVVHVGHHLPHLHRIALIDQNVLHPSGALGGNVHLGGLDAAVARRKALRIAASLLVLPVPPAPGDHGDCRRCSCQPLLLASECHGWIPS